MSARLSFGGVVRSEWTKLRSLRSTWWVLGVSGLVAIGLAGVVGWATSKDVRAPSVADAVGNAFLAIDALALVFGVFGVLLMTGEYGSGLIRATLTAVPRRLPVLAAKALVLVAATLPVTTVIAFGSFWSTRRSSTPPNASRSAIRRSCARRSARPSPRSRWHCWVWAPARCCGTRRARSPCTRRRS